MGVMQAVLPVAVVFVVFLGWVMTRPLDVEWEYGLFWLWIGLIVALAWGYADALVTAALGS